MAFTQPGVSFCGFVFMQRVPSSLPSLQGQRRPEGRLTEHSLLRWRPTSLSPQDLMAKCMLRRGAGRSEKARVSLECVFQTATSGHQMRDTSFLSWCAGTRWEWKRLWCQRSWEFTATAPPSVSGMTRDILTGQSDTTQQFPPQIK